MWNFSILDFEWTIGINMQRLESFGTAYRLIDYYAIYASTYYLHQCNLFAAVKEFVKLVPESGIIVC
jgi:hypothetical protein